MFGGPPIKISRFTNDYGFFQYAARIPYVLVIQNHGKKSSA